MQSGAGGVMNEDFLWHVYTHTIPAAYSLLPGKMAAREATAMLLAIGLQESKFEARVQIPNGPAHGLLQFEKNGGVKEVLTNPHTKNIIIPICQLLQYDVQATDMTRAIQLCYDAIVDNDVLAMCFGRCRLWIDPHAMRGPGAIEGMKAYGIYIDTWAPGKPRPKDWGPNYAKAWQVVSQGVTT